MYYVFILLILGANQDKIRLCGGLDILLKLVKNFVDNFEKDLKHLEIAVSVVGAINAAITDHGMI